MANYVLLETIELTQTATSITFDNLPTSGYTDLKIVASVRGTGSSNYIGTNILLNGTSASTNWGRLQIEGGDGAVNAYTSTSSSGGYFPDGNFTANAFGTAIYYLPSYRSSNYKTINVESAGEASSTTAVYIDMFSQTWTNTAAVTSITMGNASSALAVGCTFSLYGIAATGTTPVTAPKATGGNMVSTDGTYWYHTFLTSGIFTPQISLSSVDYLLVAGGGSGGTRNGASGAGGGGGGAGGFRTSAGTSGGGASAESKLNFQDSINYAITIGAGGAGIIGPADTYSSGNSGNNSSIIGDVISLTSVGGGKGGIVNIAPASGGSGGGSGGGNSGTSAGAGTANQGYAGGNGNTDNSGGGVPYPGGGGGGAGSVGGGYSSSTPGTGGSGVASSMSGTSVTYARGGNGATWTSGSSSSESVNTGNGSSGAGNGSSGNGGSGIVIIRYAI